MHQQKQTRMTRLSAGDEPTLVAQVLRKMGAAIINLADLTDERADAFFLGLSQTLGPLIRDSSTPQGWYPVSDKGRHGNSLYLADQAGSFPPHTDRSFSVRPPPIVGLLCKQPATRGGETILVDGRGLYFDMLRRFGHERMSLLFEPFLSVTRGTHRLARPLFFFNEKGHTCIAYRNTDTAASATFDVRFEAMMAAVNDYLSNPRNRVYYKLQRNEILLIDNHRYLHGREAFAGQRLLYRLYFAADVSASPVTGFPGSQRFASIFRARARDFLEAARSGAAIDSM